MISRGYVGLPPFGRGQRIGLFGGSFNPPHEGHRAASLIALNRLELDWVWWLVTPGNPLKDTRELPPIADRLAVARRIAAHPRIVVTGVEARLGSRFTVDTMRDLNTRCPTARFVLILGADSFATFHLWKRWRALASLVPIAIVDRPGFTLRAAEGRAAAALARDRLPESRAPELPLRAPPAYVFLHGPRSPLSSTALRARGTDRNGAAKGGA